MEKIFKALLRLSIVFPEHVFTENHARIYCEIFKGIDPDKIVAACEKWAATERAFPKPVDLIELAHNC